jgi:hypothetical protein
MKAHTQHTKAGGIGVLVLHDRALPVTCIHEFAEVAAKDSADKETRIFLTDQASGAGQYGGVSSRREYRDVPYDFKDVAHAYNIASRGYIIDLAEFCAKMQAKRKEKFIALQPIRNDF